jgi:SAM-dependent methyltransferase
VSDYREVNQAYWDERAPAHAASPDFAFDDYATDPRRISDTVRFDLPLLGDVAGLDGIHVQCHIGSDTVSLARLGARMTGLDFSPASLTQARRLAQLAEVEVSFIHGEVYEAVDLLGLRRFDLVYTGIGALCWMPDITRWAGVVAGLLRPGGRLFLREAHPVVWALSDARPDGLVVIDRGLHITGLVEHDSLPWDALPGQMRPIGGGEYQLADRPWRLPHSYTLQARRPH